MADRLSRRRLIGLGAGGLTAIGTLPQPFVGVRRAMAQGTPETVVYVSNAGGPEIHVLAMNRASGDVDLIEKISIPGVDKPSPSSMPMALSPDRRLLYAALRSEPFTVASFAIDPTSGKLRHLGNAPLEASMAYTTVDRSGRWLLAASYPAGKLTVNAISGRGDDQGQVKAPPNQVIADRPKATACWSMRRTSTSTAPCWRRTSFCS